jgi:hypothetical protein
MTAPGATGRWPATARLAGIGVAAAAVAIALYVAGRLHTPDYNFSLFGRAGLDALILKSTPASIALGLAALQVLLALWIYRKLPLAASPPRPVRLAHRIIGFALFALTVPIALPDRLRRAAHQRQGSGALPDRLVFYGAFVAKVLLVQSQRLPGWTLPVAGARSPSSAASSGTPPRSGTTTATGSLACSPHRAYFTEDMPAAQVAGSGTPRQRASDGHPCCTPGR